MDGLLIVDKPSGPTSHDVVARVRRAIREKRIGHTGTLDPLATGVLPLVVGRATRLARFLTASDKTYEASIELGLATDTHDALGQALGDPWRGAWPARNDVEASLERFRGTFLQQPPVYSAKKIQGRRSYDLAREAADTPHDRPAPVSVTAYAVDLLDLDGPRLELRIRCSAGFYVRSLAHDLGGALGVGAHLTALRRTESAGATLADAVTLDRLEAGGGETAGAALVPMHHMLTGMPAVSLTGDGLAHARFGRDLAPADAAGGFPEAWRPLGCPPHVRLLDAHGELVGLAEPATTPGLLHPAVILM